MNEPSLSELLDGPTFTLRVRGAEYRFSEIPVASMLALEGYIKANTPHPIEAIRPYLAGLEAEDRRELLERARQDARLWPPRVGTAAGSKMLMGSGDLGQIEVLYHGLLVHHPDATREHARGLHSWLERETRREVAADPEGESPTVRKIYAAIFGMLDERGGPSDGLPKGDPASTTGGFGGTSCSEAASNG